MQSGCLECVWEVYRKDLADYNTQLAKRQGKPPPKAAADPFADLERKIVQQEKHRQELEAGAGRADKRTGHAKDAP